MSGVSGTAAGADILMKDIAMAYRPDINVLTARQRAVSVLRHWDVGTGQSFAEARTGFRSSANLGPISDVYLPVFNNRRIGCIG